MSKLKIVTAAIALIAIALSLWHLAGTTRRLIVSAERVGATPVTVFRPQATMPAPVVLIAHGFAGSQQLMQPFAVTLARNGYVAMTFDFPGHGQSAASLPGGFADEQARTRALLDTIDAVAAFARTQPYSDGRLALLGHSLGADTVVRYGRQHPNVIATVGVSLFIESGEPAIPRNLLIIDGALENPLLLDQGYRIVGEAAGGPAEAGVTYGDSGRGTARRLALAPGAEHIAVLYNQTSMAEALAWLDQAFGRQGDGFLDDRGLALGLLYLGLIALAWPLSGLLPRLAPLPLGASRSWRQLLPAAVIPAVLTPLILWQLPTDILPLLLGDYLALHFGLYGLLTALGQLGQHNRSVKPSVSPCLQGEKRLGWKLTLAAAALAAYSILGFGLPAHLFVINYLPGPGRWPLIAAICCGTLPYFIADEWLTRGGPRGAYAVTKALFLASLALAIAINLYELFFLVIIVPVILAYFIIYGLLSTWSYRRTGTPLVGALANALVFAWVIAVTFPVVGG